MSKTAEWYKSKTCLIALVFGSVLFTTIGISTNQAFGDGVGQGGCPNYYDGKITFMHVTNGTYTIDPIANPSATIEVFTRNSYNVTLIIHTQNQSSQGNTDPGTAWINTDANGYGYGSCINNVGPNQDVPINGTWALPSQISRTHDSTGSPFFETTENGVSFTIQWIYPNATTPDAPANLTATTVSPSQINLKWDAPSSDGGAYITGYTIERSTDEGTNWSTIVNNTGLGGSSWVCDDAGCRYVVSYSDMGLEHSTTYTYKVSAINRVGTGSPSNTASATTFNVVPSPPIGLTATAQLLKINLNWNAPSDNGGTPITGYMIERSTDGGSTWSTLVSNTGSTGTTYSDKNVLPLTTYTYRVSAINSIGTGNPSNTASATTPSVGLIAPSSLP